MIIFICCKNKKSLKKIHAELYRYFEKLNSIFVIFMLTPTYAVFASDNFCIHLFLEKEQEIRGYHADLIYKEKNVNRKYARRVLQLAVRTPITGCNKTIKFSHIPIQTFEIRR